ncbi:hypothetical protein ABK040_001516 [Willaertia magna]
MSSNDRCGALPPHFHILFCLRTKEDRKLIDYSSRCFQSVLFNTTCDYLNVINEVVNQGIDINLVDTGNNHNNINEEEERNLWLERNKDCINIDLDYFIIIQVGNYSTLTAIENDLKNLQFLFSNLFKENNHKILLFNKEIKSKLDFPYLINNIRKLEWNVTNIYQKMFYTKNLLNWLQKNKIIKDFTFSVNDKSLKQYFTLQNFTNNNYKTKSENTNNNNYTQINTILEQIPIRKIVHHLHLNLSTDNHPCQCITCSKALITPVEDYHPFTTEFISPNSPIDKTRVCVHCRKSCHLCKQFIILLSTGSYNPVHLGHVNVFKAAKHFLENEQMELLQQIDNKSEIIHQQVKEHENINEKNYLQNFEYWSTWLQQRDCKVVGAYFSPSHQNYVNNKMKEKKSWSIPLKERCLLIDLATEENSYITSSCWEGNQKDFYTFSEITNAFTQIMLSEHHPIRILFEIKNYDNFTTRNCTTNDFENNNLFPLDISSNVLPVTVSWNPFHTLQFCYIGGADLMSMAGSNLIYKDYVFTTCVARKGSSLFQKLASCRLPNSRCSLEEIFGPVIVVHPFKTEDEALEMANLVSYGLSASVFTNNLSRAHRFSDELECGMVWVNTWLLRDLRISIT